MLFRSAFLLTRQFLMTAFQPWTQTLTFWVYNFLNKYFFIAPEPLVALKWNFDPVQNVLRNTFRTKPQSSIASTHAHWLVLKVIRICRSVIWHFKTTSLFFRSRDMLWPLNFPKYFSLTKKLIDVILIFDDVIKIGGWSIDYTLVM